MIQSGHTPDIFRQAFLDLIEDRAATIWDEHTGERAAFGEAAVPIDWLLRQLWSCTDMLPSAACETLDMAQGSTYAQAAHSISRQWAARSRP